jgi:type I restriction enzyme M protein
MQAIGRNYQAADMRRILSWMFSDDPKPYNSFGNGAAMRVSAAGFAASSVEEAKLLSKKITEVTHNHPEGIKGAEATAVAIYLAKTGKNILEIRDYIDKKLLSDELYAGSNQKQLQVQRNLPRYRSAGINGIL